jgi:hypothetical protein
VQLCPTEARDTRRPRIRTLLRRLRRLYQQDQTRRPTTDRRQIRASQRDRRVRGATRRSRGRSTGPDTRRRADHHIGAPVRSHVEAMTRCNHEPPDRGRPDLRDRDRPLAARCPSRDAHHNRSKSRFPVNWGDHEMADKPMSLPFSRCQWPMDPGRGAGHVAPNGRDNRECAISP